MAERHITKGPAVNESIQTIEKVNALIDNRDRLNDWMQSFVDSVAAQITQGRTMSAKQESIIQKEWDKLPEDIKDEYPDAVWHSWGEEHE